MTREEHYMMEAIQLSRQAMEDGSGGPFGCVIVLEDQVVGRGWNQVLASRDPTAHAEVVAIRDACHQLGSFHLPGCEIYSSCEPCPMCLGAIYWARLGKLYFANTRADAAHIGFNDAYIYGQLSCSIHDRMLPCSNVGREEALKVFDTWMKRGNRSLYY